MLPFSLKRTKAILMKEFIHLKRDMVTLQMIVMVPIMQLLVFGYALNNDPKHMPTAVISHDNSMLTRSIVTGLKNTDYFAITHQTFSEEEAHAMLQEGKVQFVVSIPDGFMRDVIRGEKPQLLVEADATDPTAISGALGSVEAVVQSVMERDLKGTLSPHQGKAPPVDVRLHRRYNPEGFTRYNIIPGLVAIILTMTGVMMTALAITRERERGTMENLLVMPVRPSEVMLGKIIPYIIIGYLQAFIIIVVSKLLFGVPIMGSLTLLAVTLFLFIASNMAMGFLLSAASQNQAQSLQLSMMVTLPSIMLSGFLFPFRGMPLWAQMIGSLTPATYFIRISRGILLKGNNFIEIWPHIWPLLLLLAFIAALAVKKYRQTLD
jgi:ABC-2 type transport system permease protein